VNRSLHVGQHNLLAIGPDGCCCEFFRSVVLGACVDDEHVGSLGQAFDALTGKTGDVANGAGSRRLCCFGDVSANRHRLAAGVDAISQRVGAVLDMRAGHFLSFGLAHNPLVRDLHLDSVAADKVLRTDVFCVDLAEDEVDPSYRPDRRRTAARPASGPSGGGCTGPLGTCSRCFGTGPLRR